MAGHDEGETGVLTLAAVPIGRAEDASPRLAAELSRATVIAAEDTRRVRWLAASLNVTLRARIISYYDAVEARRTPGLLGDLQAGLDVLLVTDAGTPGISDPGYRLVAAAAAAGIRVTALPGPSAARSRSLSPAPRAAAAAFSPAGTRSAAWPARCLRFPSLRARSPPAVPGLNAMAAARQANGTATSTYR